jgi:amidase
MLGLSACGSKPAPASAPVDDALLGKSIVELQRELEAGSVTSEALVRAYLKRIEALDRRGPALQSVLALNPDATDQARSLDAERRKQGSRGPLHGIPILLKDNIESADNLPTTAGSLALVANVSRRDAPIVANLRAAGAVILGKTNLSEWANFRSDHSLSGWSALGGLTKNAHVLDRSPCGSSAGSAVSVAAGFASASVGTETDGSITCPAAMNGIVGLKPTVGLLSQQRIVPIAHSQDAPGPMAVSVIDAAVMLSAMIGDRPACDSVIPGCKKADYVAVLTASALQGKRVGVLRFESGRHPRIELVYDRALDHLRDAGATLVEVTLPDMKRIYEAEGLVLHAQFKADLNAYLAAAPAAVRTRDLSALIAFNRDNSREMVLFGQDTFLKADQTAGLEEASYKTALADSQRLAAREGITRLLSAQQLNLLVAPTTGAAWRTDVINGDHFPGSFSTLPAVAGFPHLTVPMGAIEHLPLGISFIGPAWSEDLLLAAGFAFEERAKARIKPRFLPSIDQGAAVVAP